MSNSDQLEEVIKEIAVKHGVAVGHDDPILIMQTINNRLMHDSEAAQAAMLEQYKEELEGIAIRWGDDAKAKAERMLNAALASSKEAMAKTLQDGAASAAASGSGGDRCRARRRSPSSAGRTKHLHTELTAAALTLLAAGLAIWAALAR